MARKKSNPVVILILGVILLVVGIGFFLHTAAFVLQAKETVGSVASVSSHRTTCTSGGKHKRSYPCTKYTGQILFIPENGRQVTFSTSIGSHRTSCSSCGADYHQGAAVPVIYDPSDPGSAKINTFFRVWGIAAILGTLGLILTLVGWFSWKNRGMAHASTSTYAHRPDHNRQNIKTMSW